MRRLNRVIAIFIIVIIVEIVIFIIVEISFHRMKKYPKYKKLINLQMINSIVLFRTVPCRLIRSYY